MTAAARAWLNNLNSLYTPTSTEFDAARKHRHALETRLDVFLGLHEMFEIGSMKHGTGVWQYSDADFLASLKGARPSSPWTMLNKVKEALQGRYPLTSIVVRRPAIVCRFSDGDVEVVPAYEANSGYWISDPAGEWMRTFPKDHNKYVTEVNKKHDGAAKKLARQLKVWKYKRSVPVSSCYLEMRAAKHMDGEQSYSPLWDLYLTLRNMQIADLASMNDPTGLSTRFGACSSESSRQDALSKLSTAFGRALKAKDYEQEGKDSLAINQLELLFNQ
ncbi:nucleotidyltransferase [Amycolatopsis sp. NPDC001319]|uniref:SMODS domain-containing nucleotidyltransferase n=1 Tax=unclassified Amycolatopsis TaxID=2618356 RepID=UPI0036A00C23